MGKYLKELIINNNNKSSCSQNMQTNFKLKHMKLKITSISANSSPTDETSQTPTPIRFIRNCEESGLFNDLQIDNPFEEGFRKALDQPLSHLGNTESPTEDSLHTPIVPNVFMPKVSKVFTISNDMPQSAAIPDKDDGILKSDNSDNELQIDCTEESPKIDKVVAGSCPKNNVKIVSETENGTAKISVGDSKTKIQNRLHQKTFRAKEKAKFLDMERENENLRKLILNYQEDLKVMSLYILSGQNGPKVKEVASKYLTKNVPNAETQSTKGFRKILPKTSKN